jgi:hypothetical protein
MKKYALLLAALWATSGLVQAAGEKPGNALSTQLPPAAIVSSATPKPIFVDSTLVDACPAGWNIKPLSVPGTYECKRPEAKCPSGYAVPIPVDPMYGDYADGAIKCEPNGEKVKDVQEAWKCHKVFYPSIHRDIAICEPKDAKPLPCVGPTGDKSGATFQKNGYKTMGCYPMGKLAK